MIAFGEVAGVEGGGVRVRVPGVAIGSRLRIAVPRGFIGATVTSLCDRFALASAEDSLEGVQAGAPVCVRNAPCRPPLGTAWIGATIEAFGGIALPHAPEPFEREPLDTPFWTGVRAIDGLLTIACGARVGIFGPPGAGKSTLLHAIVRHSQADAVVLALIGERGREAEEWARIAPPHATIVCATGDRSASSRIAAAHAAMAQAHALRSRGLHVLLVVDSLARYANALREAAIANGEPAGRAGYPPGVFAALARYTEVAGAASCGSITALASVLSDGDERDPVSDAARSLLDGHLQLCPKLAAKGHFPAIDVLQSASRTMVSVAGAMHRDDARCVRAALAQLAATADARSLGIGVAGEAAAQAVMAESAIEAFLQQGDAAASVPETLSALSRLADTLR